MNHSVGVNYTPELHDLVLEALEMHNFHRREENKDMEGKVIEAQSKSNEKTTETVAISKVNANEKGIPSPSPPPSTPSSIRTVALSIMPLPRAIQILKVTATTTSSPQHQIQHGDCNTVPALTMEDNSTSFSSLPLIAVRALRSVFVHLNDEELIRNKEYKTNNSPQQDEQRKKQQSPLHRLELALSRTQLCFKNKKCDEKNSSEQIRLSKERYKTRMERLRMRSDERKYTKLTSNIDRYVADDVSVKGMMYATSIGLNMIVAPIATGTVMFFFAGALFNWIEGDNDGVAGKSNRNNNGAIDIKRIIAGVVSGVAMLIIEMVLFVIRSHEMDRHVCKKVKIKGEENPFGFNQNRDKVRNFYG